MSSDFEIVPKPTNDDDGAAVSPSSALDLRVIAPVITIEGARPSTVVASTPVPGTQRNARTDLSWADNDNEDSQAIEFYLSAVERKTEGRENQEASSVIEDEMNEAETPANDAGRGISVAEDPHTLKYRN